MYTLIGSGSGKRDLTHLPLEEMAAISQMIFRMHFHEWQVLYFG